jgi:tetratricopeptide (TPR) repeat protein
MESPDWCFRPLQPAIRTMKKLIIALIALAGLPAHADKAAEIYKSGLIAVQEGNVKAAEAAFREVLRLQPGNANARYQLSELRANQGSIAARARAKKLGEYTIDQIDFSKTELSEALAALAMLVEEKSDKKFSPNFMIQDPANQLGDRLVTLQVKSVPAKAVLDMLIQQAGGVAKFEEHAIVIKPVPKGDAK